MEKKEAIVELNKIYSELYSIDFDPVVWTSLTKTRLKKIFPISYQEKIDCIECIQYSVTAPLASQELQNRIKDKGTSQAGKYIIAYIDEINQHAMEKGSNNNHQSFLGNLSTFWGIVTAVVVASFMLGMYIGNTKFDSDKNDYYDQVKALSSDTTENNKIIRKQNIIINQKDSILNVKSDSIKKLEENIQNAYFYNANNIDKK